MMLRVATILPIPFLLWALVPTNPYAYYVFLRILCFACFGFAALAHVKRRHDEWAFAFAVSAIVYNPIFRVHMDRFFWSIVNVATIGFLIWATQNNRAKPH